MQNKFLICVALCALLASSCGANSADAEITGLDSSDLDANQADAPDRRAGQADNGDSAEGVDGTVAAGADDTVAAGADGTEAPDQPPATTADGSLDPAAARTGISTKSSSTPDTNGTGTFEQTCTLAKEGAFDPLQGGSAPLNFFFGNTGISETSTNDGNATTDISTGSGSSCPGGRADLSSYWVPAMYDAAGTVVRPDSVRVTNSRLSLDGTEIQAPPAGLSGIAGNRDASSAQSIRIVIWNCVNAAGVATPGYGTDSTSVIPTCSSGDSLTLQIGFPQCWNGTDASSSSPNSFASPLEIPAETGANGEKISRGCTSSHPVALPFLRIELRWRSNSVGDGTDGWYLSSDDTDGNGTPDVAGGTTAYAGWMSSWDSDTANTWVENCLGTPSSCFGSNLGNGSSLA